VQARGKPDCGQDDFGHLPVAVTRGIGAGGFYPCANININDVELHVLLVFFGLRH